MLIFERENQYFVYIHIPKNSGTYIREKIKSNNKIIKNYWNVKNNLDLAHIPYIKKDSFIEKDKNYKYFSYSRNPYDRIISAFFYRNPDAKMNPILLKDFIKNKLITFDFNMNFNSDIIHYYPQYLFICDVTLTIPDTIKIEKLENIEKPRKYDINNFLDDECIQIINNIYNKDFLLLNYIKR